MSNATKINLDTASRVDVTCRKGDTFSLRLTITTSAGAAGFSLRDTFRLEVRESDTGALVNNGSTDFFKSVMASSADVTNKYIDLVVDSTVMKTMPAGLYVYDIEQASDATPPVVSTLIFGTLKVNEDVSVTA